MELLLKHGADTFITDKNGRSVIAFSAAKGFSEITSLLMEYDADPYLVDMYGKNAIDRCGNVDLITIMQKIKKKGVKRSKSTSIVTRTQIFPRVGKEFWKKNKFGRKVKARISEKVNELTNAFVARNTKVLSETLYDAMVKEKEKIVSSNHLWVKMHSKDFEMDLMDCVQSVSKMRLPTFDIASLFGERFILKVKALKKCKAEDLTNKIAKTARVSLESSIQNNHNQIFHEISALLKEKQRDLSYEITSYVHNFTKLVSVMPKNSDFIY